MVDLLIKGGTVIDPSQNLNAVRDVAITNGVVSDIQPSISESGVTMVYNASGKIVTPGLVDLLVHPWPQRNVLGVAPDTVMKEDGVTTMVSPGDPGPGMMWSFSKEVVEPSKPRVFAYVMISSLGYSLWPNTEIPGFNQIYLNAKDAAGAMIEHSDIVVGVKVRPSEGIAGTLDLLPVQRAIEAATIAEGATGKTFRVVCHIGALRTPGLLAQIVDILRSGDVITHCFDGNPNSKGQPTGFAQGFAPTRAAYTAKAKGIIFDVGWGGRGAGYPVIGGSFDYLTAAICLAPMNHAPPGIRPDSLSSDAFAGPWGAAGRMKLHEVMSNFLALNKPKNINYSGFASQADLSPAITLGDVVRMATVTPASVINRVPLLGTLKVGAPGDIAVFALQTGQFTFNDTLGRTLSGTQKFVPVQVIKAGVLGTANTGIPPPQSSVTITFNGASSVTKRVGEAPIQVAWNGQNVSTCTLSQTGPMPVSGQQVVPTYSGTGAPLTSAMVGTTQTTITCTKPDGGTISATATLIVNP